MRIGILGIGFIGNTLVRKLSAAGHNVLVANSRGPETVQQLADEAGATAVRAAEAAVQTHGGFGFAEEYDVERKFRETRLYQVAPISTNMILSFVSEHVLGLPRSY